MNLIERITAEMDSDEDNIDKQSVLLAETYADADDAGKAFLDTAFICLCGWSLKHLIEMAGDEHEDDNEETEHA